MIGDRVFLVSAISRIEAAARSPQYDSLAAARAYDDGLTLDEYTLARVVMSEAGQRPTTEMCAVADASLNQAGRRSIHAHATAGTGDFGEQGHGSSRPMSTRQAPGPRHIETALAVLRRPLRVFPPPLRGIARGAIKYMNPRAQASSAANDPSRSCPPLVVLERWTYSLPWGSARCTLGTKRGGGQLEWVGPIPGINAYELMLFRPATLEQDSLFAEAKRVIETRGVYQGRMRPIAPGDALVLLALVGAGFYLKEFV